MYPQLRQNVLICAQKGSTVRTSGVIKSVEKILHVKAILPVLMVSLTKIYLV